MKKLYVLFFLAICQMAFATNNSCYDLEKIYPYTDSDFFKNEKELSELIIKNNVKTVVEIGPYLGKSTIFMAKLLPETGKVYAIDSWVGYPITHYEVKRNFYQIFLSNVIHEGCTDKITPIKMTSLSASRIFSKYTSQVDMVYIDADHSYTPVYCDIHAWSKHLKKNGILCGNLFSKFGETKEIKRAVMDFCKKNKRKPIFKKTLWIIE